MGCFQSSWTPEEIETLKRVFSSNKKHKVMDLFPGKSWSCIRAQARRLSLTRLPEAKYLVRFTQEELNFLKENYRTASKKEIEQSLPKRSWATIYSVTSRLGLSRGFNWPKSSNLSVLLEDNLAALYWVGFLLADGSLMKTPKGLYMSLNLSCKDLEHMKAYCSFIEKNEDSIRIKKAVGFRGNKPSQKNMCFVRTGDVKVLEAFSKKYDFKSNKTYNPPTSRILDKLTDNQIISLIIGLTDGDGCITLSKRNQLTLEIVAHSSWKDFYTNLAIRLNCIFKQDAFIVKNRRKNIISMCCYRQIIIKSLKKFILRWSLIVLDRKWGKVKT